MGADGEGRGGPGGGGLVGLDEAECRRRLENTRVGRLGLVDDGDPLVLPVNFVFDGNDVIIRTAPGTKLDEAPLSRVAFEIDGYDEGGNWGWSVVVKGTALDVTDTIDLASERQRKLTIETWAPGEKGHWLRISSREITGRAFGNPPD